MFDIFKMKGGTNMSSTHREKDFLLVDEVKNILRIGKSQCYDFVNSPDCPFNVIRVGKLIRIPSNNFFKWYDSLGEELTERRGKKA